MDSQSTRAPGPRGRGIRYWLGRAWAELVSATEWFSHGNRLRPHFSEKSTIYDPTAGWDHSDPVEDESKAERGDQPDP